MACGRSTTTWRWRGHWEAWKTSRRCGTATGVHERGNSRRTRDKCRVVNQSTSSRLVPHLSVVVEKQNQMLSGKLACLKWRRWASIDPLTASKNSNFFFASVLERTVICKSSLQGLNHVIKFRSPSQWRLPGEGLGAASSRKIWVDY